MSDDDSKLIRTDIGPAESITMDDFCRTLVEKMFENDNNVANLEVTLNSSNTDNPPKIEIELCLVSINGVKTRSE